MTPAEWQRKLVAGGINEPTGAWATGLSSGELLPYDSLRLDMHAPIWKTAVEARFEGGPWYPHEKHYRPAGDNIALVCSRCGVDCRPNEEYPHSG